MAEELLKEPFSSSSSSSSSKDHDQITHHTVLARLPLILSSSSSSLSSLSSSSSSSSRVPVNRKQWVCDSVVNIVPSDHDDFEVDDGGKMLRRALLRIREAFRYVFSYSSLSLKLSSSILSL